MLKRQQTAHQCSQPNFKTQQQQPNQQIYYENVYSFLEMCKYSPVDKVKDKYLKNPYIDIRINDDEAFRNACEYGNLPVCKWLIEICDEIYIHSCNYWAFRFSCSKGHLDVVKWLFSLDAWVSDSFEYLEALKLACYSNHTNVVEWLLKMNDNIRLTEYVGDIIITLTKFTNVSILRMLYERNPTSLQIYEKFHKAVLNACEGGKLENLIWLYELDNSIAKEFGQNEFYVAVSKNHINIIDWFVRTFPCKYYYEANEDGMITLANCFNIGVLDRKEHTEICEVLKKNWIISQEINETTLDEIQNSILNEECTICYEMKNAHILFQCGHSCCLRCAHNLDVVNETFKCHMCRHNMLPEFYSGILLSK